MFGLRKKAAGNRVELGDKVDPNGFRLVTSRLQPLLCPAVYREEGGRHILEFETEGMALLSDESDLAPEWVSSLLRAYCGVIRLARSRELVLQNFRWDNRFICFDKDGFRFQYVPNGGVKEKTEPLSLLTRQLKLIPTSDPRIQELLRELKRCRTEEDALALLEQAAGAVSEVGGEWESAPMNPPAPPMEDEGEAETTALSAPAPLEEDEEEGETTPLTPPAPSPRPAFEQRGNTAYLGNAFDEGETTVLSALPHGAPARPKPGPGGEGLALVRTSTGDRIKMRGSYFLVGADTNNMDYSINNPSVSRHHATITYENGSYYIMDNKSTNGTRIEGVWVPPYEKVELTDGAILTLGNEVFQIEVGRG